MITSGVARRPTGLVRVNRRAPYADKLVGAYLFSQSSGGMSPDVLGRTPLFHDVGGLTLPAAAPFGMGISSTANPTFLSAVAPPYVGAVAVGGVLTSTSTGLVLGQGTDTFAMGSFEWGMFVSSGTWRFGYGFLGSSGSGTSAPLGRFDVGLSRNATTGYGYVDGIQVNSNSSSGGGTSTNPIRGSTVSSGVPFGGVLDYALLFGCYVPDWVFAEVRRNPYQYFRTARQSLWYAPAAVSGFNFSAASALSLGASAAVVQGVSLSATSALSLGSAAALTFVGPPTTISATSALSLGAASTVTLTSPALSFSAASALSLGSSAALSFATATTISATSALSLGASAAVTLTSPNVGISASSGISLGASAGVAFVGPPTTISASSALSLGSSASVAFTSQAVSFSAASSLSLGSSAAVTLRTATTVAASSALSLGASVQVAFTSAYATLLEAVVATLRAGMVTPGDLTGVYDRIPPTLQPPYATCVEIGNSRDWTNTAGGWIDSGQIQVAVYATRKKAARTLGDSVAVLLNDADLSFDEGNLMLLRQDSRFAQADPDREPGGEPLYAEIRTFRYMISSGLS